ncbi:hypothetical protein PR048_005176 [Dryococelus australis]|uniref:Uncharacterized protein n=1 Tax=Dryococelus australis TaxID=614101 RepID=A0ABQ9I7I6_9NEOP|nr:hypothetical protein PR048_005176 [Dryococelus australis]
MDAMPYGPLTPNQMIECENHLLRNYNTRLLGIVTNCISGTVQMRNVLLRLRISVQKAAEFRDQQPSSEAQKDDKLKMDILNGPYHVFRIYQDSTITFVMARED